MDDPGPGPDTEHIAGLSALLLLSDGRYPSGGHAHSGGMEAAELIAGVRDLDTLHDFLVGRLSTVGTVAASFAAAAAAAGNDDAPAELVLAAYAELDAELDARTPSPVQRRVARQLGRQLLRAARTTWPSATLDLLAGQAPQQPIAQGAVAAVAGLGPGPAALAAAQEAVAGPTTAAIRLLALDPFEAHALIAGLAPRIEDVARSATLQARRPVAELAANSGPLLDLCAEQHATWEVRLFAS